jgi:hypothetical protein
MENWRELVGWQKLETADTPVFYLHSIPDAPGVRILKEKVNCELTEGQVLEELDKLFSSFTHKVDVTGYEDHRFPINRGMAATVKKSRRGMPNTRWKSAMYYKGSHPSDAAVIVAEYNGKFAVFPQPTFDDYGFIIIGE